MAMSKLKPKDTDSEEERENNKFRNVKTRILNPKGVSNKQL